MPDDQTYTTQSQTMTTTTYTTATTYTTVSQSHPTVTQIAVKDIVVKERLLYYTKKLLKVLDGRYLNLDESSVITEAQIDDIFKEITEKEAAAENNDTP